MMSITRVLGGMLGSALLLPAAQLVWALAAGSSAVVLPNIIGGPLSDAVVGIAVDRHGYVWIAGTTFSPTFPAPTPIRALQIDSQSMFVAKVAPDGSAIVNLKMFPEMAATAMAMDSAGNVYVAGSGSVLKFDPAGAQIPYSVRPEFAVSAMAVNGAGELYLAGSAPVTSSGGFQTVAIVERWSADGTAKVSSKTLGGSRQDAASGIALDRTGAVYLTGFASSPDFPVTTGAYQTQASQYGSGFATKLSAEGALVWSTFLPGGSPNAIAADAAGNAYIAGGTGRIPPYISGGAVAKLDAAGSKLIFSHAFDSSNVKSIQLDNHGNVHFTGRTLGLPVAQAFESTPDSRLCPQYTASGTTTFGWSACSSAFVAALDPSGANLLYSTYLNGTADGAGLSLALDNQGNTYVGGEGGLEVAATNPISNGGGAFVVKLQQTGVPPFFTPASMTNGADFVSGLARPGGIASIFCTGLSGISGVVQAPGYPLPTELAGVTVRINGIAAPLFSVSDAGIQQINLQVPSEITSTILSVEVSQHGSRAWVWRVDTAASPPGLFAGAIQHGADYSLVTADAPAHAGEVVVVYGTGFGAVTSPAVSGTPAPGVASSTTVKPTVTVGGEPAEVLFAGLTPGLVGVYQLNIRLPADLAVGNPELVVSLPAYGPVPCACAAALCGAPCPIMRLDSNPVRVPVR